MLKSNMGQGFQPNFCFIFSLIVFTRLYFSCVSSEVWVDIVPTWVVNKNHSGV